MFKIKLNKSLRLRLLISYVATICIPVIIIVAVMPYYFRYYITKDRKILTESTLSSVASNIEMYINDLDRLTLIPYYNNEFIHSLVIRSNGEYSSDDEYKKLIADRTLRNTLRDSFVNTRKDIVSTILLPMDGTVFYTSINEPTKTKDYYDYKNQEWYKKAIEKDGGVVFISPHDQDYFIKANKNKVFSVARLIKDPFTQNPIAVMMADADTVIFKNILSNITFNVSSIVTIFDEKNNLIYSTEYISPETQTQIIEKNEHIKYEKDNYDMVSKTITGTNWNINVLLSSSEIKSQTIWIYVVGVILALIGIVITYVFFVFFSSRIVKSFKQIINTMREVEEGNLSQRVDIPGDDEIARLGSAFNRMIENLNEHINREYKAVINQRNAEYAALQSQIQPHFLYNTLNNFIGLNRIGDKVALEQGILDLTGMLRYILNKKDLVPLSEELTFIKSYCELQKLRFRDRLEFSFNYDEQQSNYRIPKLLFQPIIENSVIHCVEEVNRKIHINVIIKIADNKLIIILSDDGDGFDTEKIGNNNSIGISNVRERLEIMYKNSSFSINSKIGVGTEVIIEIPMEELEHESNNSR
jgi:two-component system sensor histidine kinase YesM